MGVGLLKDWRWQLVPVSLSTGVPVLGSMRCCEGSFIHLYGAGAGKLWEEHLPHPCSLPKASPAARCQSLSSSQGKSINASRKMTPGSVKDLSDFHALQLSARFHIHQKDGARGDRESTSERDIWSQIQ